MDLKEIPGDTNKEEFKKTNMDLPYIIIACFGMFLIMVLSLLISVRMPSSLLAREEPDKYMILFVAALLFVVMMAFLFSFIERRVSRKSRANGIERYKWAGYLCIGILSSILICSTVYASLVAANFHKGISNGVSWYYDLEYIARLHAFYAYSLAVLMPFSLALFICSLMYRRKPCVEALSASNDDSYVEKQ